jgi:hypothetical protein
MCTLRLTGVGVVRVRGTGANLGTGLTNIVGVLTAHPTDESTRQVQPLRSGASGEA